MELSFGLLLFIAAGVFAGKLLWAIFSWGIRGVMVQDAGGSEATFNHFIAVAVPLIFLAATMLFTG